MIGETTATIHRNRVPVAAGLDTAIVVLFVAIGRRNHDEEPGIAGLVETAAPFLIGLVAAWVVSRAWRDPTSIRTGLVVWPVAVAGGMIIRRLAGDGTAISFVIVTTVFLGAFLVGWRVIAGRFGRG
jgi:hypothetical protein